MPLSNPNILSVWFTMEVSQTSMVDVMVIETGLHLNAKNPDYDANAVDVLLNDAREYLKNNTERGTNLRIMSIRSDQI